MGSNMFGEGLALARLHHGSLELLYKPTLVDLDPPSLLSYMKLWSQKQQTGNEPCWKKNAMICTGRFTVVDTKWILKKNYKME